MHVQCLLIMILRFASSLVSAGMHTLIHYCCIPRNTCTWVVPKYMYFKNVFQECSLSLFSNKQHLYAANSLESHMYWTLVRSDGWHFKVF